MTSSYLSESLPDYIEAPPYTLGTFIPPRSVPSPFPSTFTPTILKLSTDGSEIISSTSEQSNKVIYTLTSSLFSAGPTTAIRLHRVKAGDTGDGSGQIREELDNESQSIPVYVIAERYARPLYRGISTLSDLAISQSRGRWTFTQPSQERDGRLGSLRGTRANSTSFTGSSSSARYQNPLTSAGASNIVGLVSLGTQETNSQRPGLSFEDDKWWDVEGVVIATCMQSRDGTGVLRTCVQIEERQMDLLVAAWCVVRWGEGAKKKKRRFSLFGS